MTGPGKNGMLTKQTIHNRRGFSQVLLTVTHTTTSVVLGVRVQPYKRQYGTQSLVW